MAQPSLRWSREGRECLQKPDPPSLPHSYPTLNSENTTWAQLFAPIQGTLSCTLPPFSSHFFRMQLGSSDPVLSLPNLPASIPRVPLRSHTCPLEPKSTRVSLPPVPGPRSSANPPLLPQLGKTPGPAAHRTPVPPNASPRGAGPPRPDLPHPLPLRYPCTPFPPAPPP